MCGDRDRAFHPGFVVSRNKASEFELACVREFPDDLAITFLGQANGIWIVVLHLRELLHQGLVLHHLFMMIEYKFVFDFSGVFHDELYGFTLLDGQRCRFEDHGAIVFLDHRNFDGAVHLGCFASFPDSHRNLPVTARMGATCQGCGAVERYCACQ